MPLDGLCNAVSEQCDMGLRVCVFFRTTKSLTENHSHDGIRRFSTRSRKQYIMRDSVTGDVEYMEYFGMTMVPTLVVGNGSVSIKGSLMDKMLLLCFD